MAFVFLCLFVIIFVTSITNERMFTKPVSNKDEAIAFLNELHAEGRSYHPDDKPEEVIYADCTRVFTDEEAVLVSAQMGRCFDFLGDSIYEVLLAMDRE